MPKKTATKTKTKKTRKPKATSGGGASALDALRNAFRDALAAAESFGSGSFVKLGSGVNVLRLLPAPATFFRQHDGGKQQEYRTYMDLDFIFGDRELLARAKAAGKITDQDEKAMKKFGGDPFNIVNAKLLATGQKKEAGKVFSSQKFYLSALVRPDNTPKLFVRGKQQLEAIVGLSEQYPEIFDINKGYDILYTGTGEGLGRRYQGPMPAKNKTPAGISMDQVPDLLDAVVAGVVGYKAKVVALFQHHSVLAVSVGITPKTFGMSDREVQDAINELSNNSDGS